MQMSFKKTLVLAAYSSMLFASLRVSTELATVFVSLTLNLLCARGFVLSLTKSGRRAEYLAFAVFGTLLQTVQVCPVVLSRLLWEEFSSTGDSYEFHSLLEPLLVLVWSFLASVLASATASNTIAKSWMQRANVEALLAVLSGAYGLLICLSVAYPKFWCTTVPIVSVTICASSFIVAGTCSIKAVRISFLTFAVFAAIFRSVNLLQYDVAAWVYENMSREKTSSVFDYLLMKSILREHCSIIIASVAAFTCVRYKNVGTRFGAD